MSVHDTQQDAAHMYVQQSREEAIALSKTAVEHIVPE
jgi:hypothetical protein